MRALLFVVLLVPALTACKDKAKAKAIDAKVVAAAAPDAAVAVQPGPPLLAEAGPPPAATDDDCALTGEYFKPGLRAAAVERDVAIDKLDQAQDALVKVYIERCRADEWPGFALDCMGKSPTDLETYRRCFERLSTPQRNAWFVQLDGVVGPLGGTTQAVPVVDNPIGTPFEEVCATFVNEVGRLDDCAGSGMYVPDIEAVYTYRRNVEVGALIPPTQRDSMAALCDERAAMVRKLATENCRPPE